MTNFVEACAAEGARLVFFDNLYMYGPQTAPLSETTPLQPVGVKPAARVAATRIWMAASEAGRLRVAALRAPDFYGPGALSGPSRRHRLRRAGARRPRAVHRLARHAARLRLCAGLRARRRQPARRARRRLRPGLARSQRADPNAAPDPRPRRGGDRRRADARSACRPRCSARSACSFRRCANSPRCGSSGIGPTLWIRAASPSASGPTRRRSRSARRRPRGGFATAPPNPAVDFDQQHPRIRAGGEERQQDADRQQIKAGRFAGRRDGEPRGGEDQNREGVDPGHSTPAGPIWASTWAR